MVLHFPSLFDSQGFGGLARTMSPGWSPPKKLAGRGLQESHVVRPLPRGWLGINAAIFRLAEAPFKTPPMPFCNNPKLAGEGQLLFFPHLPHPHL